MLGVCDVVIGSRVGLLPDNHPIDYLTRSSGPKCGASLQIGTHAWLGGNVTVNTGMTIGAGQHHRLQSFVTRDIPASFIAACSTCRSCAPSRMKIAHIRLKSAMNMNAFNFISPDVKDGYVKSKTAYGDRLRISPGESQKTMASIIFWTQRNRIHLFASIRSESSYTKSYTGGVHNEEVCLSRTVPAFTLLRDWL